MTPKTHCTAKELAGLPGMPKSIKGVIDQGERGEIESRPTKKKDGSDSKFLEYSIASLPAETRKALATQNTKVGYDPAPAVAAAAAARGAKIRLTADKAERNRLEARAESLARFNRLPAWQQKAAKAKLAVIKSCNHYITTHQLAKTAGQNTFCHEYDLNQIDVAPWVRAAIPSVHPATLRSWIKDEHDLGMMGLVDCYGNRKDQSKIETWNRTILPGGEVRAPLADAIVSLILKYPHIKEKACNESLRAILPDAIDVSDKSVKRYMDKWKAQNKQEYALAINPDDYKNRFQPAFGSRSEGIDGPNQKWEIDATPADLLLTDGRHKIIGLADVGPRRLKFYVNKTERARDNAFAVRRAILDWGVPAAGGTIVTDQGAPYLTEHFERILSDLEINQHICNPYSGDEKPHIERGFQTLSHDLIELLPGYCGHSVSERQAIEARKSFAKRLKNKDEVIEIAMTSEELQAFCDRWCESYHNTVHSSLRKTPNQVMAEWPHPIRRISDERALDMLLCEAVRPGGRLPIIGKKGIRVNGGFYIHPALGRHVGEYCRAFAEPVSLGRIIVHVKNEFDAWEFLCIAEDPDRVDISRAEVAVATRELHNEHKKEMARHAREAKKAIKGVDIVSAVLAHREKKAAIAKGNVTHLPQRSVEHITPGLSAAMEAAAALERRLTIKPEPAPDVTAAKERLKADMERSQASNVASIQVESVRSQYRRWKRLKTALSEGQIIDETEYQFYRNFGQSAECRAYAGMEEELGAIAK